MCTSTACQCLSNWIFFKFFQAGPCWRISSCHCWGGSSRAATLRQSCRCYARFPSIKATHCCHHRGSNVWSSRNLRCGVATCSIVIFDAAPCCYSSAGQALPRLMQLRDCRMSLDMEPEALEAAAQPSRGSCPTLPNRPIFLAESLH